MSSDLQITIPHDLVEKIEKRIAGSEHKDAREYILYLIRDALGETDYLSRDEELEIKRRLGKLGYE